MMNKLTVGDLLKSADRMKARLCEMEAEIADAERRLARIEEQDALHRSFIEATVLALPVAHLHSAPRVLQ
jgi:hypothetical protein